MKPCLLLWVTSVMQLRLLSTGLHGIGIQTLRSKFRGWPLSVSSLSGIVLWMRISSSSILQLTSLCLIEEASFLLWSGLNPQPLVADGAAALYLFLLFIFWSNSYFYQILQHCSFVLSVLYQTISLLRLPYHYLRVCFRGCIKIMVTWSKGFHPCRGMQYGVCYQECEPWSLLIISLDKHHAFCNFLGYYSGLAGLLMDMLCHQHHNLHGFSFLNHFVASCH